MKVQTLKFNQPASKQRGSVMLWALLGLLGFAALAWFCVAKHVPLLEQRLQTSVLGAIKPLNAGDINVEMNGYAANISGDVQDSTVRDTIIAAAGSVAGVRTVNDNLQQLIASPISANVDSSDQNLVEPAKVDVEAPEVIPAENPESPEPAETPESLELAETQEPATPVQEPEATPAEDTKASTDANGELAELNISVADRTLTLTGRVQDQRELRPIVEVVMTTFDLNYVSNKTSAADSIAPMEWMDGLVKSMPELVDVKNPSIDVFGQQITLGGMVGSEADQQGIIESVQKNLPNLSVVNRLRVEGSESLESTDAGENIAIEKSASETEMNAEETTERAEAAAKTAAETERQAAIAEEFQAAAQEQKEAAQAAAKALIATQAAEAAEAEAEAAEAALAADEAAKAEAETEDPIAIASRELSAAFSELPDTRILFQSGSDVFAPGSEDRLDQIAELLSKYPTVPVDIKGHTDSQGDDANNLALSQLRANAVRDYLASEGISVFRLSSFGYGEGVPIASNDTQDGRAANRRIEFSF